VFQQVQQGYLVAWYRAVRLQQVTTPVAAGGRGNTKQGGKGRFG